jgi:Uma2 family endonuclease
MSTVLSYHTGNEEYQIMMTVTTTNVDIIKDAIAKLPPGQSHLFRDVAWAEYKQITEENERPGVRVTYDRGSLEIMSPLAKHERYKDLLAAIARIISDETDEDLESLGSTTFSEEWLDKGLEPDTCFYAANAAAVIGKDRIDLNIDPPPDIAVEIDISSPSIRKLPIYQEMRVPEVWLYNEKRLRILWFGDAGYTEFPHSLAFPFLTADVLTQHLDQSKTKGQSAVLRTFRKWLRLQLSSEDV